MKATAERERPAAIDRMPDLAHLDNPLTTNLLLNALSFKAGTANPKARALWTNFVRLLDQTTTEYNRGREALARHVGGADPDAGALFRATAHMETCLISLKRAVRFARRIRMKRDCPRCGELSVTSDAVLERLQGMCRELDGIEESVLARNLGDAADMLVLDDTGLRAADETARYEEVAGWIGELNTLAVSLTDYEDPEGPEED